MNGIKSKKKEKETIHLKFHKVPFGGSLTAKVLFGRTNKGNPKFKLY